MRKETINTFSDGMSLDLNPLGTPAKTLTNCLNGTLITYNGNELTLQNDMGNVPVGTAALPKGYVPVGMKEYGGIIYVASYNPETKKGQLGCFPSPQLIYTSEVAQTALELNILDLFIIFDNNYNVPIINIDEYREEIFKDAKTLEARVFNSGNKFIIKTNNGLSNLIRQAIDDNILTIKLYVIPLSGETPIELSNCENSLLKTYQEYNSTHKDLWIFQNDGNRYIDPTSELENKLLDSLPLETILSSYPQFLQTYKGPAGTLEIVFEFNTFELFNLYRLFRKSNNSFEVQFIGEATPDQSDLCNIVSKETLMPFELYGNINSTEHNLYNITKLGEQINNNKLEAATSYQKINNKLVYDIMPACPYGVLKLQNNSYLKSGELTNEIINNSHNRVTNWKFEINSDHVIVLWTYTTFLNDPEIDHMRFVFIPLDKVMDRGGLNKDEINSLYATGDTEETNPFVYTIRKTYYSGDFEDKILIGDEGLNTCYIYLCRLDVIYKNGNVINGQDYKLLYTGTFFNNKDISLFNNNNRPIINPKSKLTPQLSYTVESFNYTVLIEDENGTKEIAGVKLKEEIKSKISANDVMFLANNELYYNKIIGIIVNVKCKVTSTLHIQEGDFFYYNDEKTEFKPRFAGNIDIEKSLDQCANNESIVCNVANLENYKYNGEGDETTKSILEEYITQQTILDITGGTPERDLDGANIIYKKINNRYENTSIITIHRGIISRLGTSDFYDTMLEGLFPVYDPSDYIYNQHLFGFTIDDDGGLLGIIGGDDFMGLSLWAAKNKVWDVTTSQMEGMIEYERSYQKKTALSRYDFKGDAMKPYHYGSSLVDGAQLVNFGSSGTSRIEAMKACNYAPILILASNRYERVWDKSYWDGDVDTRICNLMVLPHSIYGENLRKEFDTSTSNSNDGDGEREKHYGFLAKKIRDTYIKGAKNKNDNIGGNNTLKDDLFKVSRGNTRAMYILWKTQYGYQIMNLATPLDIEYNATESPILKIKPEENNLRVTPVNNGKNYKVCDTHLRADHMLFCLLSQILITKKKTHPLSLNAPNINQILETETFKTVGQLNIPGSGNLVVTLAEKYNIEDLLTYIIDNNILKPEDNFIPKFIGNEFTNGNINCGGIIALSTLRYGLSNVEGLFYADEIPEFSTVTDEQRLNIWPGKIEKVIGTHICKIELDELGLYKINETLVKNTNEGKKFYKIFLPTILGEVNNPNSEFRCTNEETYTQTLEGFAYNDLLLPLTKLLDMRGLIVGKLLSLEDPENPFFNLLYYNSIDLNDVMFPPNTAGLKRNSECTCDIPLDLTHGFAFATLFGDQSRYLDAHVYIRNKFPTYTDLEGGIFNLGFTDSTYADSHSCSCYNIFGDKVWAVPKYSELGNKNLITQSNVFKLGTNDWITSKISYSGASNPGAEEDENLSTTLNINIDVTLSNT